MPRPLKVFLCHASQDKPAVWKLYRYLKQHGISPWLDQADLLPGQNWEVEIPNALFNSDVILVCLSKNSVNKEGYVQKEIAFALDKALEKPAGTIFIIPVRLENCDVPKRLSPYQWVDYFRPDGRRRLLMGLDLRSTNLGDEVAPVILDNTRKRTDLVSKEKSRAEEDIIREKAERDAKEQAEREAAEKAAREKAEKESAEKAAREKAEQESKEQAERNTSEKVAREKVEREAKEREAKERAPFDELEDKKVYPILRDDTETTTGLMRDLFSKEDLRWLAISGTILVFVILCGLSLASNLPSSTTEAPQTMTVALSKTNTPAPTRTLTPVPPTFTPTPGIGSTLISEKDGMVLVYIPEGEFTMGSDANLDEQPIHQVYLDTFWIDQTEVTNAMYAEFLNENGNQSEGGVNWLDASDYDVRILLDGSQWVVKDGYADHPVTEVSWFGANAYCKWAGRELPTEAQWEKAARGTDGRTYPWGEEIDCSYANYLGQKNSCVGGTTAVGSYPEGASIYGALDMAGNVWEWVSSLYQGYPYDENDGREDLSASGSRVLRGGSWSHSVNYVRSSDRYWVDPKFTYINVGFRCSLSP